MWARPRLRVQPAALLLWALAWFFDSGGIIAALLPGVLIHEMGHYLFLRLARLHPRSLSLGLFGLEMDYFGCLSGVSGFLVILAGPIFGLVWAIFAALQHGEYWSLTSGLSLSLSLVNLLPVLPLDGGRLLSYALGGRSRPVSFACAVVLTAAGLVLALVWHTLPPLILSLWLLRNNLIAAP